MKNIKPFFDAKRKRTDRAPWTVDLRSAKIKTLNGKSISQRHFFETEKEAQEFANVVNTAQGLAGYIIPNKNETLGAVADLYIANCSNRYEDKLICSKYDEHCRMYANVWKNIFGNHLLTEINFSQIQDIIRNYSDQSHSSQTARLAVLKDIFKLAIKHKIIATSPADYVFIEMAKYKDEAQIEAEFEEESMYSIENFRSVIEACDIERKSPWAKVEVVYTPLLKKALVAFAMQTGLRFGEQAALRWKHLNFETKRCHVRVAVRSDKNGSSAVSIPKTIKSGKRQTENKQRRIVPLPPSLIAILKAWRLKSHFSGDDDLVFPRPDGSHRSDSSKWNEHVLGPLCEKAGIKYFSWHKMRHFYASLNIQMFGCKKLEDLLKVSARMGHASLDFTWKTYGHMIPDFEQDDLDGAAMDEALYGSNR